MSEQDNLAIARQSWDVWNAHDANAWIKLLHDSHVTESDTVPGPIRGREGARPFIEMYLTAFPDLQLTLDDCFAADEKVAARWTVRGTHKGAFFGVAPTEQVVTVIGVTLLRLVGDSERGGL